MHANFCALFRGDSWQSSGVIDRLAGMQATPKQLFRYCAHAMQGYRYRSVSVLRAKPVYLVGNLIGVKKSKKYVFASAPAQAACLHKSNVNVIKCHACHAKSCSARQPQPRHQSKPSAVSATPATPWMSHATQTPTEPPSPKRTTRTIPVP